MTGHHTHVNDGATSNAKVQNEINNILEFPYSNDSLGYLTHHIKVLKRT